MSNYILNALPLSAVSKGCYLAVSKTDPGHGDLMCRIWESYVGHQDVANVISDRLSEIAGQDFPVLMNRAKLPPLHNGDLLLVGQYVGPRLPEGTTKLPDGAKIEFYWVQVLHPNLVGVARDYDTGSYDDQIL